MNSDVIIDNHADEAISSGAKTLHTIGSKMMDSMWQISNNDSAKKRAREFEQTTEGDSSDYSKAHSQNDQQTTQYQQPQV